VNYGDLVDKIGARGPRPARSSKTMNVTKLAIPIVYAIVTAICWTVMSSQVKELDNLRVNGVLTTGTVTGHHVSGSKSRSYHVEYRFNANNSTIFDDEKVSHNDYDMLWDGTNIQVTYLPNDTTIHRLGVVDAERVARLRSNWQLALALITGVAAIAYGLLLFTYRRQLLLLGSGHCVRATIDSIRVHRGKNPYRVLVLRYISQDGQTLTRKVTAPINADWAMNEESEVPYLYMADSPKTGAIVMQLKLVDLGPGAA
jgi:hypothetical protein